MSPEDKIGHFFIVDIKCDIKNANDKTLLFNEIYIPVFEKEECLHPSECFVFQLMDTMIKNGKGHLNSYKYNKKTHATMKKKMFIPLNAELTHFVIKRVEWLVTKINAGTLHF